MYFLNNAWSAAIQRTYYTLLKVTAYLFFERFPEYFCRRFDKIEEFKAVGRSETEQPNTENNLVLQLKGKYSK